MYRSSPSESSRELLGPLRFLGIGLPSRCPITKRTPQRGRRRQNWVLVPASRIRLLFVLAALRLPFLVPFHIDVADLNLTLPLTVFDGFLYGFQAGSLERYRKPIKAASHVFASGGRNQEPPTVIAAVDTVLSMNLCNKRFTAVPLQQATAYQEVLPDIYLDVSFTIFANLNFAPPGPVSGSPSYNSQCAFACGEPWKEKTTLAVGYAKRRGETRD